MSYYDETAEKAILGAALTDPRITKTTDLDGKHFAVALHAHVWEGIRLLHAQGITPDLSTIAGQPKLNLPAVAPLLTEVVGLGVPANAEVYAATIRDRAERFRISQALDSIRQRLDDPATAAADALAYAETAIHPPEATNGAQGRTWGLDEFLDRDLGNTEWVIPDLLAKGDRLVLTGIEGFGKSILMRQLGVCLAAGMDPFTMATIPAKRVLLIDCENPERIMMRKLGDLRRVMHRQGLRVDKFQLKRYPQGLNLAEPRERLDLHHTIATCRPDLLLIGPAYKLYVGGGQQREEDLARLVTSQLDALREEFGFALVLEHHSPHGNGEGQRSVRPIGSSLWLRWPEFGYGIRPAAGTKISDREAEFIPWRGSRDERPWPRRLDPGGENRLPWIDTTDQHGRNAA